MRRRHAPMHLARESRGHRWNDRRRLTRGLRSAEHRVQTGEMSVLNLPRSVIGEIQVERLPDMPERLLCFLRGGSQTIGSFPFRIVEQPFVKRIALPSNSRQQRRQRDGRVMRVRSCPADR